MNAEQSPCRKTQVSAGQIEKEVCQILADLPKRVQEIPLTDRMRLKFPTFLHRMVAALIRGCKTCSTQGSP
jgi:hypothetical protein